MSASTTPSTQIVCDESGNTGENVTGSQDAVFSEGSHDLTISEATKILDWVRAESGSKTDEVKWKSIRQDEHLVHELFSQRLHGRARFYLTEKSYFVVGKVVDLLLEEHAHRSGFDLYTNGEARRRALLLYRNGRRSLGDEMWTSLLGSFNSLMRRDSANQKRKAVPKTTVEEFFDQLDAARSRSTRRNVTEILHELVATRSVADEFVAELDPAQHLLPALDPIIPSIAETIRHWYYDKGKQRVDVLHDEGPVPSSAAMDALRDGLQTKGEFRLIAPPVAVGTIATGNSANDVRLQLADLVAGFGAQSGRMALQGSLNEPLLSTVHDMILPSSIWGDDESAELLGLELN